MQTQKVIDFIVNWLETYAKNAKVKGFVVASVAELILP